MYSFKLLKKKKKSQCVLLTCVCPTTPQPVPCSVVPPWWRWRHSFLCLTLSDEGSPHTVEPACREKPQRLLQGKSTSYLVQLSFKFGYWQENLFLLGLLGIVNALMFCFLSFLDEYLCTLAVTVEPDTRGDLAGIHLQILVVHNNQDKVSVRLWSHRVCRR